MAFDIGGGVEAAKKVAITYALPLMIGAFIVALAMGFLKK